MSHLFILLLLFISLGAQADTNYHYTCTQGNSVRLIEVAYLVPKQKVPCEVRYQKENAQSTILWRADNQESFCESKTQRLIEKQKEWGFDCKSENAPTNNFSTSLQANAY